MLSLVIGNKNYSSWSMRPWVLLTERGIPFAEILLKFHSADWDARIARLSPSRLVPVLWDGPPGEAESLVVNDSLAIAEYLHERFPHDGVWPNDVRARAAARSAAAEMHSGFRNLRMAMPMNIHGKLPGKGHTPEALADVARVATLWAECRARFGKGGPFLFGEFSAADAMFAPVVMRFATYAPPLPAIAAEYCEAVQATASVSAWVRDALLETEFVADDEPYTDPPQ